MNMHELMNLIAGGLQFVVALYALRLNRVFGPNRVGWSLFCAFSLLALLHLFPSVPFLHLEIQSAIPLEVMYALISLLLLASMAHIESLFRERRRLEQKEIQLRAQLEVEVQMKTQHLTRAIEALQAEVDERRRMEAEVEAHVELLAAVRQTATGGLPFEREPFAPARF